MTTDRSPDQRRRLRYRSFAGPAGLSAGTRRGLTLTGDGVLRFEFPAGEEDYTDPFGAGTPVRYEWADWTSPPLPTAFDLYELIASWRATTPGRSWLTVSVGVPTDDGGERWYPLARWADRDDELHPTSVPYDRPEGRTNADTFVAGVEGLRSHRLRGTLHRPVGGTDVPELSMLGVLASGPFPTPAPKPLRSSRRCDAHGSVAGDGPRPAGEPGPLAAGGHILDVPRISQRAHRGEYPHWDGGGDSWCSPTSTCMVLRYWGVGPDESEYSWVDGSYQDRFLHHAVRHCYDYAFSGAGNWAFNTAYAGRFGLDAFVTRLRDLTEAERFVAAGIPLVAAIRFSPGELTGADYTTNGHLLTIVGFTGTGDVVVNDPAAKDRESVRRSYDRVEFAAAWLRRTGGTVYVIRPPSVALPPAPGEPNW